MQQDSLCKAHCVTMHLSHNDGFHSCLDIIIKRPCPLCPFVSERLITFSVGYELIHDPCVRSGRLSFTDTPFRKTAESLRRSWRADVSSIPPTFPTISRTTVISELGNVTVIGDFTSFQYPAAAAGRRGWHVRIWVKWQRFHRRLLSI